MHSRTRLMVHPGHHEQSGQHQQDRNHRSGAFVVPALPGDRAIFSHGHGGAYSAACHTWDPPGRNYPVCGFSCGYRIMVWECPTREVTDWGTTLLTRTEVWSGKNTSGGSRINYEDIRSTIH